MNKLFNTDLRSKLSQYANERVAAFSSNGGEYITVILESKYEFANLQMQQTTFRTLKELKELTKKSNIIELKEPKPAPFDKKAARAQLTEKANAYVISLWHGEHYTARLKRGYKLEGYTPNEDIAYDFETLAEMIDALNSADIVPYDPFYKEPKEDALAENQQEAADSPEMVFMKKIYDSIPKEVRGNIEEYNYTFSSHNAPLKQRQYMNITLRNDVRSVYDVDKWTPETQFLTFTFEELEQGKHLEVMKPENFIYLCR